MRALLVLTLTCLVAPSLAHADDELSLENVKAPTANATDEPLASGIAPLLSSLMAEYAATGH